MSESLQLSSITPPHMVVPNRCSKCNNTPKFRLENVLFCGRCCKKADRIDGNSIEIIPHPIKPIIPDTQIRVDEAITDECIECGDSMAYCGHHCEEAAMLYNSPVATNSPTITSTSTTVEGSSTAPKCYKCNNTVKYRLTTGLFCGRCCKKVDRIDTNRYVVTSQ